MWFKNLHLYRLHQTAAIAPADLETALAEQAHRAPGASEARRCGWYPPAGKRGTQLAHEIQGQRLLTMMRTERLLPAGVVREEVEERADEIEQREGRKLRKQERQELKEQVYEELLPRAFTRSQRIDAWWDTKRQLIGVNAASRARAEEALDLLRETLGSLKVTPLATQTLPIRAMTEWLNDAATRPAWLSIGDRVELRAKGDDGVLGARQVDLDSDEIHQLAASGRQATRLAIEIDERVAFVLGDDLAIKSLRFADKLLDEASETEDDGDAVVRLEADFILMANALGETVDQLVEGLGGEAQQAPAETGTRPDDDHPGEQVEGQGIGPIDDPLYPQAVEVVNNSRKATVSHLQRVFKIGYNRAAHLIEALESGGVVSPMDNQGRRQVLGVWRERASFTLARQGEDRRISMRQAGR